MSGVENRRLPAEWEPVEAVLMAWPHKDTDWLYVLDQAECCFAALAEAIAPYARVVMVTPDIERTRQLLSRIPNDRLLLVPCDTNDTWTRDYGPITIMVDGKPIPLDFGFNGWGLKFPAYLDNLITQALDSYGLWANEVGNHLNFILEGGSIESDGMGTVMTTDSVITSPNRNGGMTEQQTTDRLKALFGASRVVSLHSGALLGDDTDGHIDTLARFAPPGDIILYTGCADPADPHYKSLKAMRQELSRLRTTAGKPYRLEELPLPDAMYDTEGNRLPATYANFLIVNKAVIFPTYGRPLKDRMAADIVKEALPEYTIVPVDCSVLVLQHGSLHCSTMQLPVGTLAV